MNPEARSLAGTRRLASALRALALDFGNRELGLLGVARVCTSFAAWAFAFALAVYGFEAHGAVGVGLVALVRFLPGAIVALFAGLLIDRYPRRSVLLASSVATTVVLTGAAAAAWLGAATGIVYVFAGLFAVASCSYGPAESALMPSLAKTPQELSASNVTHSAMENTGFLLAAITSGFLLSTTAPEVVFAAAAAATVLAGVGLAAVPRDERPTYLGDEDEHQIAGVIGGVTEGMRSLIEHPALRLASLTLVILILFEGFAEILVVVMALELLHLEEGSVGFLNAAWGIGALVGGAGLAVLLDRDRLVVAIAGGSIIIGAATMLPGIWPQHATVYVGWLAIGLGFTLVEVAAKTLMQRFGSDDTLGRVIASLESARLAAMALGSIGAVLLLEIFDTQGALIALSILMPAFVIFCWSRLRAFEVGAPVAEEQYQLLRDNSIFAPLPIATLERLSHDVVEVPLAAGVDVIVQGEHGDQFFVIESGEVEVFENGVFRRNQGPGQSFGEIALLHDVRRTATVRTTTETQLLSLERDQFLTAVTGHRRSRQVADHVVGGLWDPGEIFADNTD